MLYNSLVTLRFKEVLDPCKKPPILQILWNTLIAIGFLLKGYTPIRILIYEQPDDPFCNVPYIKERNGTHRPPSKPNEAEYEGKDCSNSSHLYLLSSMNLLMSLIYLVEVTFLPDKDNRPDTHGLITIKGYETIPDYNHILLF